MILEQACALIPTGSMEDTVMTGSRVVINRLAYVFDEPQRGDIVSFYYPEIKILEQI